MWSYTAYGLPIRSALPLPELPEYHSGSSGSLSEYQIPVGITVDPALAYPETIPDGIPMFSRIAEGDATLVWPDVGTFCIRNGREIGIAPVADADPATIRLFLLGPVLSVLIHQRGWPTLHGSAVDINGHACIFLGGSGWGKSTMCAAMHARGHGAITDDVSTIQFDGEGRPIVYPAFPRLKVWPDAAAALGENPAQLEYVREGIAKRSLTASNFSAKPVPLARIYVLAKGNTLTIRPIPAPAALLELVTHTFGASLLQKVRREQHFKQYGQLVCATPIQRLTRPWSLDQLPDVIDAVEADVQSAAYENALVPVSA